MEKKRLVWTNLKNEPLSFKIGLVLGIAHLYLFLFVFARKSCFHLLNSWEWV